MTEAAIRRPDLAEELGHLKDFQRNSVETVFRRLYLDAAPTRRFLVADEVGLGKTLVARGVIARTIDHLWDKVDRIDVIYLCSNSDIARQNVARLTPGGISGVSLATRITLLPTEATNLNGRKVNVVALTPGTSLNLKGNLGVRKERALLQYMIEPHWKLDSTGASRLFAGNAGLQSYRTRVRHFGEEESVDAGLHKAFLTALDAYCAAESERGAKTIRARLTALVKAFGNEANPGREIKTQRARIIGELRHILAKSCIQALEPDLIVLDEFQRFKELLDGEGPAGEMARELFEFENETTEARVLLLSATPYKMYTVQDDAGGEDHYQDFLRTARFLFHEDATAGDKLASLLKRYREELFRIGSTGIKSLATVRDGIEQLLRTVMIRTERLAVTPNRDGMLVEKAAGTVSVNARDATNYRHVQALARLVDHSDTMEYWKAAPWLLNFMDTYKLRTDIKELIDEPTHSAEFRRTMKAAMPSFLKFEDVEAYRAIDAGHGRLRWLLDLALGDCLWKMLWLPPTMPYYELGTPFAGQSKSTKSLLFSAWRVVPRVVAAALSYEAERRAYVSLEGDDVAPGVTERLGDLLAITRKDQKAAGLTALALMYPSTWLAGNCDPLKLASALAMEWGRLPTLAEVLAAAETRIERALKPLMPSPTRTAPDESWYWAAPIILDRAHAGGHDEWPERALTVLWSSAEDRPSRADDEDAEGEDSEAAASNERGEAGVDRRALDDFVARVRAVAGGDLPTGVPPKDLVRALALMAIAGPATVALRSLSRITGDSTISGMAARDAAAAIGASFRTLFNQPDSTAIVRSTARDAERSGDYWKECLYYSAVGGLQPVLDEFAHLLVSEAGVFGQEHDKVVKAVQEHMSNAIGMRRASVGASKIAVGDTKVTSTPVKMRSRFAMRFGEERADEAGEKVRADDVRKAFNSPFWPFVLATTSVGQEGLDFHHYCHRVIHWNLPPNPVDLEQREGRVHRFKGHAVRKNVAETHSTGWHSASHEDPWQHAFESARAARKVGDNDLVPYWVFPLPDGAAIERYVPLFGLSRDVERFKSLRESLAIYRMVFGQPRQEELLSYLARVVPSEKTAALAEQLSIDLSPQP